MNVVELRIALALKPEYVDAIVEQEIEPVEEQQQEQDQATNQNQEDGTREETKSNQNAVSKVRIGG